VLGSRIETLVAAYAGAMVSIKQYRFKNASVQSGGVGVVGCVLGVSGGVPPYLVSSKIIPKISCTSRLHPYLHQTEHFLTPE